MDFITPSTIKLKVKNRTGGNLKFIPLLLYAEKIAGWQPSAHKKSPFRYRFTVPLRNSAKWHRRFTENRKANCVALVLTIYHWFNIIWLPIDFQAAFLLFSPEKVMTFMKKYDRIKAKHLFYIISMSSHTRSPWANFVRIGQLYHNLAVMV